MVGEERERSVREKLNFRFHLMENRAQIFIRVGILRFYFERRKMFENTPFLINLASLNHY